MKIKTEDLLPKIAANGGTVHQQFVRCGKASCKCARGELHGAYYYHFVRIGGRLKKRYLKREIVEAVQTAVKTRRDVERRDRAQKLFARKSIRDFRERLNEVIQQLRISQAR